MAVIGCEKPTAENIDKWMTTERGPGKLADAVGDGDISADLSARAAVNLARIGKSEAALERVDKLSPQRLAKVLPAMVKLLGELGRIEGEMTVPQPSQVEAKDLLWDLRGRADDGTRTAIDGHLAEWFAGGYFPGRAKMGRINGMVVARAVGPAMAPKLIAASKTLIGGDARNKLPDELLIGLAATGDPAAARLLLDIHDLDRADPTLADRVLNALYTAYVDPAGEYAPAPGEALKELGDRLAAIAADTSRKPRARNDAMAVLSVTPAPACLAPILGLMTASAGDVRFEWMVVDAALRCGKIDAIEAVARALPARGKFEQEELMGALAKPAAALTPASEVVARATALLTAESRTARWAGVEILAAMGEKAASAADQVAALGGDKEVLAGYFGDQGELPRSEQKREPTLGERATEVSSMLRQLANGAKKE